MTVLDNMKSATATRKVRTTVGDCWRKVQDSKIVRRTALVAILASSTVVVAYASTGDPGPFEDSFEGSQIYPFWTVAQSYGEIVQSNDQAYSGSHSLKFSSSSGGTRSMTLVHRFPALTKGSVSIAFYDSAPGQETLYEQLTLSATGYPGATASVGTMDFDATCYEAGLGTSYGPNAICGTYPQLTTTPVRRTAGWHIFTITYGQTNLSISIDGVIVFSRPVNYTFDTVQLAVSGPSFRPDTVAYFDDFKFTPIAF